MKQYLLLLALSVPPLAAHGQGAAKKPLDDLHGSIFEITQGVNAKWAVYIKSIETGEEVAINADVPMEAMSTIKIPLMIEVLEQVKAKRLKLSDKYILTKDDMQGGTGTIQFQDAGAIMTIKDLITYMIVVSDNTATEVLYRKVGGVAAVNARMRALGLKQTR